MHQAGVDWKDIFVFNSFCKPSTHVLNIYVACYRVRNGWYVRNYIAFCLLSFFDFGIEPQCKRSRLLFDPVAKDEFHSHCRKL